MRWEEDDLYLDDEDIKVDFLPVYCQWLYMVRVKIEGFGQYCVPGTFDKKLSPEQFQAWKREAENALTCRSMALKNGYAGNDSMQIFRHAKAYEGLRNAEKEA